MSEKYEIPQWVRDRITEVFSETNAEHLTIGVEAESPAELIERLRSGAEMLITVGTQLDLLAMEVESRVEG